MPKKFVGADDDEGCQTKVGRSRSRKGAGLEQGKSRNRAGAGRQARNSRLLRF